MFEYRSCFFESESFEISELVDSETNEPEFAFYANKKLLFKKRDGLRKRLPTKGEKAKISTDHKCVDEYDNDGFIIGQHYPREIEPTKSTRVRFVKVPDGQGNYIMVTSEYKKRNFTNDEHLIKHVDKTNKDSRWNKK